MADATEDLLFPRTPAQPSPNSNGPPNAPPASDSDSEAGDSDTAPDYTAFLSSLSLSASSSSASPFLAQTTQSSTLPKRGTKDFEPHPTVLQTSSLQRSRDAMAQALSYTRVHAQKVHVRGVYDSATGLTRVGKVRGQMFSRLGRDVSGGGVELLPEEALWGLERGALDVVWLADERGVYPTPEGTPTPMSAEEEHDDAGLPMSLQAAYAAYIGGAWGLTAEKYVVYAGLKRAGFVVLRADGFHGVRRRRKRGCASANLGSAERAEGTIGGLWAWLRAFVAENEADRSRRLASGPLAKPGLYRSYNDIYSMLRIIPSYIPPSLPTTQSSLPPEHTMPTPKPSTSTNRKTQQPVEPTMIDDEDYDDMFTPYTTIYNIYRPLPNFRKSAPGKPDFRVCVVSARDTQLPTLTELDDLLAEQPFDPPPAIIQPVQTIAPLAQEATQSKGNAARGGRGGRGGGRGRGAGIGGVYNRLKHGQRNVLLAVVDEGVASYMRVCEAGFAGERLYERVGPPVGRGGKGGGRGRGGGARGGAAARGRGG